MKKLLLSSVLALAATSVAADKWTVFGIITDVKQDVKTTYTYENRQVCKKVRVENQGAGAGDVLGGMILGGLAGKGASGNDKGAAIGAIIGGVIAAENKKGQGGYSYRQVCNVVTEKIPHNDYTYTITYDFAGFVGQYTTKYGYNLKPGQEVQLQMELRRFR